MKRITTNQNIFTLEPASIPYMYIAHVNDDHKMISCNLIHGVCDECNVMHLERGKNILVKRWIANFSNGEREIILDFGAEAYRHFQNKVREGNKLSTQSNCRVKNEIDRISCKKNQTIEAPQIISVGSIKQSGKNIEGLRKIDCCVWELS